MSLSRPSRTRARYVTCMPGRREMWQEHDKWPAGVIKFWTENTRDRYNEDMIVYMKPTDGDGASLYISAVFTRMLNADDEPSWGYKIPPGYTTLYVGTCLCGGADMDCTKDDADWILIRRDDPRYV